jgi:DNA-directed RNA polymerase subunit RPC12/RpoP
MMNNVEIKSEMKKVSSSFLFFDYPDLMKEWHPTKNKELNLNELLSKSHKKVWWICKVNPEHEWKCRIADRTDKGQGCPYCSGRRVTKENCLGTVNPELAKEWHPTKNETNTPFNTMANSGRRFWWQCEKGHEWEASPDNRNNKGKKRKCPYCAGLKYSKDTSLAVVYPNLAKEWHPTKNHTLSPLTVSKGSTKKFWWQCSINPIHEWQATINTRRKGHGCPYCAGTLVTPDTSLGARFPHLIPYWHPTKNGKTTPFDIMPSSHKKYWWICEKGHEWYVSANGRTKAKGCAYCLNKLVSVDNNLAVVNPELAKEWHPTKNGMLTPYDVLPVGAKKVWWICSKNSEHEWEATIANRKGGRGCPICAKEKQTSFYEQALYYYIKMAFPDTQNTYQLELDPDEKHLWKKETLEIDIYIPCINMGIEYDGGFHGLETNVERDIRKSEILKQRKISLLRIRTDKLSNWKIDPVLLHDENKEVTFEKCIKESLNFIKCNHKGITKILSDTIEQTIKKVNLKKDRGDILSQYTEKQKQKSLGEVYPILSKEWHITKNGKLTPFDVLPGSGIKVWWRCNKNPNHEWEAFIYSRVNGTGCPYCSGRRATKENCLATVNPELTKQWHPTKNGCLTPYDLMSNSGVKVWWQCEKGHEWEASCNHRNKGQGCPYCSGKRATKENCLATVNPELAKEWHPTKNKELTPYNVLPSSNKKVWWQGSCGHEWEAIIANRSKGNRCPYCRRQRKFKIDIN